jgi:hypothetical protein
MSRKWKGVFPRSALAAVSIIVCLLALELGLRVFDFLKGTDPTSMDAEPDAPLHILVDAPYLYGLNPAHAGINSHGLRDDEFSIPKSASVFRLLLLGDSVPYGVGVDADHAFPSRLEALLRASPARVEVLNAGVIGYTIYNELQFYLSRGREFQPDLVLVAFSLNDVVNPRLHWNYTKEVLTHVPPEAIPNPEYDSTHVLPILEARAGQRDRAGDSVDASEGILSRSRLYRTMKWRVRLLLQHLRPPAAEQEPPLAGHLPDFQAEVPTYLTGEDAISITVLLDESSPEWQWLTSMYSRLQHAVTGDGARFAVALVPMGYQLDEGYPYFPQVRLAEYLEERGVPCLDLLPALRAEGKERVFMLSRSGYYDVWHLTPRGHLAAAQALADFLRDKNLLEAR